MKELTRAEEEVMQVLWKLKKGSVAAIIKEFPNPKPAYNTVSTVVRILESKGFVSHEKRGKGYIYYSNQTISKLVDNYFQGSFTSMVSFFMKKNDMNVNDLELMLNEIKEKS